MKRPLAIVAFLYAAGILLARFSVPLPVLYGIAFLLLILAFILSRWRLYLLCPVLVLAGWINLAQKEAILSPHDIRKLAGANEAIVTIRGKLSETPYHRLHKENDQDVWTSMARVELTGLQFNRGDWQPVLGSVLVNVKALLPDNYCRGQIVEIAGVLHPAKGPVAEGLFDYREYLRQQGIHYQLRTDSSADWQIISSPKSRPLEDRFTAWAKKALALGLPAEDQTLHLEWALTLGWKAALTQEVSEPFIRAST
jgi:predicted membrane metal-binding protein